jgi:hypothetical protein
VPSQGEINHLVSDVLKAVELNLLSLDALNVTLSGFSVMLESSTALLRDGDLLEIDLGSQNKKRKRPQNEVATTPAPKKAATGTVAPAITEPPSQTRPSRSARRKAAKRLRKRQGLALSFPTSGRRNQHQPQQKAAQPNGRFKATALAAVDQAKHQGQSTRFFGSSSEESDENEEESGEDEETTSSSSANATRSSTSSDTSSSSSSSSSSDEEQDQKQDEYDTNKEKSTLHYTQSVLIRLFPTLDHCTSESSCGMPSVGHVVAYKLLEIGEDYAPRVRRN